MRVSGIDQQWNTLDIENMENAYLNPIHEFLLWDYLEKRKKKKN